MIRFGSVRFIRALQIGYHWGMQTLIERLIQCEKERFSVNEYRGCADASPFTVVEGSVPALVSAPHAVTHLREGRVKASEDFTGPIALELARATGAHAIVATRFDGADPNADPLEASAYKRALVEQVRRCNIGLVLDIHGMVTASAAIIAVGTGDGANVARWPGLAGLVMSAIESRLAPFAEKHGKQIVLDGAYAARGENTVAATVARECEIPALQVELSTLLRYPGGIVGHTPLGEANPFSERALPAELSARLNPDIAAVEATFDALAEIVRIARY